MLVCGLTDWQIATSKPHVEVGAGGPHGQLGGEVAMQHTHALQVWAVAAVQLLTCPAQPRLRFRQLGCVLQHEVAPAQHHVDHMVSLLLFRLRLAWDERRCDTACNDSSWQQYSHGAHAACLTMTTCKSNHVGESASAWQGFKAKNAHC